MDGGDRNPQRAGLFPVHVDPVFGHVFQAVGPNGDQSRVLCRHPEELVASRHQGLVAQTAPVQQLKVKSLGRAQLDHGRGRERQTPWRCGYCESAAMALPATALTFRSIRSRSSQSFSLTNTMPLFCALPEKLMPAKGQTGVHRLLFVLQEIVAGSPP